MRSTFFEGLIYLDLLEIYGSSRLVGELCFLSQSNVYRAAMSLSADLDLDFGKHLGCYTSRRNSDVLSRLRAAARLLRARGTQPLRFLGDYRSMVLREPRLEGLWFLPQTWLGPRKSLQALDAGVLDLLVMRSNELTALLALRGGPLAVGQWTYTPTYALLPLNTESVQLYVNQDHPLARASAPTSHRISQYPSPAYPDDLFPGLHERLKPHGLCTKRITSRSMAPGLWEEMAIQASMVVASTPNAVSAVTEHSPGSLIALDYNTGLLDHDLLVVPIDLLDEPSIQSALQSIAACYRLQLPERRNVAGVSHALLHSMASPQPRPPTVPNIQH